MLVSKEKKKEYNKRFSQSKPPGWKRWYQLKYREKKRGNPDYPNYEEWIARGLNVEWSKNK